MIEMASRIILACSCMIWMQCPNAQIEIFSNVLSSAPLARWVMAEILRSPASQGKVRCRTGDGLCDTTYLRRPNVNSECPAAIETYCVPSTMYVIGEAATWLPR